MSADESSWVFDSLVGFLRGPVWNVPIMTFIEQKSLIFEPGGKENEQEYRKIHEEYKNLVDFMLGSYMEDIGITPDQFEQACNKTSGEIESQFHQTLFEQVWAANDYEIFERMMVQKNIELQLQALELLQQQHGITPESFLPDGESQSDEESKIMEEVIKKSIAEHLATKEFMDKENQELQQVLATSQEEHHRLETEKHRGKEKLKHALEKKLMEEETSDTEAEAPAPYNRAEDEQLKTTSEVDDDEMKRRQEYLKAQRDKLLVLKKAEREKQLNAVDKTTAKSRPKSARAAQTALKGTPQINPKTLQIRKALAERLKAEVIGKK